MQDYSLSLIPPEVLANKARTLSEDLRLNFGEYIPHVTLCWAGNDVQDIQFSPSGNKYLIHIRGFYCDVDQKDRVWVGLRVELTDELVKLRAEYISDDAVRSGKLYFPHLTLGCITKESLEGVSFSPLKDLAAVNGAYEFSLHLCHNGKFGKVIEVLS
ncbi:hypothetical protein RAAC3_TM7C00001G0174 [Candidatus Saccharibacteria bacterium RAAC3_TM7_1]|nr:hypothetical protein RAAC3_TM7C00001G0174 [Candidatus Saccharibacteria bacterium RAAC3_TM7_1]HCZ28787.1 hypothetical protein [Candidatus Saccharibacteria bacterium]